LRKKTGTQGKCQKDKMLSDPGFLLAHPALPARQISQSAAASANRQIWLPMIVDYGGEILPVRHALINSQLAKKT